MAPSSPEGRRKTVRFRLPADGSELGRCARPLLLIAACILLAVVHLHSRPLKSIRRQHHSDLPESRRGMQLRRRDRPNADTKTHRPNSISAISIQGIKEDGISENRGFSEELGGGTACVFSNSSTTTIPRIIHQSWRNANIPQRFEPWIRSWLKLNPSWKYVFWEDGDNQQLIQTFFPQFSATYAALTGGVARADFARYALLYQYGGVYADMDFECKRPFERLLKHEGFVSSEPMTHARLLEGRGTEFVCNAIMASRPRHPFWLAVMQSIESAMAHGEGTHDPVSITGPRRLDQVFRKSPSAKGIAFLPEEFFYPEYARWNMANLLKPCQHPSEANREACQWLKDYPDGRYTNNTHAVHHWECTWCRGDRALTYQPITRILGSKRIHRPFACGPNHSVS